MRIIIQAPCFNEDDYLLATIKDLLRKLDGGNELIWLVINDERKGQTIQITIQDGRDHVVSPTRNLDFSCAFQASLETCLWLGAVIILFIVGIFAWMFGVRANLFTMNRRLEDISQRIRCLETKILPKSDTEFLNITDHDRISRRKLKEKKVNKVCIKTNPQMGNS
jgi:glycosyltransferase involved in cell wall biosynthesis